MNAYIERAITIGADISDLVHMMTVYGHEYETVRKLQIACNGMDMTVMANAVQREHLSYLAEAYRNALDKLGECVESIERLTNELKRQ